VLGQNFFYRRFYSQGWRRRHAHAGRAIAGQSVIKRDPVSDGNAGRLTGPALFHAAIGFGADGS